MDINKVINYWLKTAELKWDTAETLKKAGKYADSLFFCHLTLESLLKALITKITNQQAPYIHDLVQLAEVAGLQLTQKQRKLFVEANSFNLRARYDDYKMRFYKKATKNYTNKYFSGCNEVRLWLLKELQKKGHEN